MSKIVVRVIMCDGGARLHTPSPKSRDVEKNRHVPNFPVRELRAISYHIVS